MRMFSVLLLASWALSAPAAVDTLTLSRADSALLAGDYETAIQIYRLNLEQDPSSYRALFGYARALAFSGKRMEAIQAFSDMLALYPDDPDARLGRGRILAWEKRYGNAESDLRLVTNRFPTYADAWSALGDLYLWSGRPDSSAASYTEWVELRLEDPVPYIARAKAHQSARLMAGGKDRSEKPFPFFATMCLRNV